MTEITAFPESPAVLDHNPLRPATSLFWVSTKTRREDQDLCPDRASTSPAALDQQVLEDPLGRPDPPACLDLLEIVEKTENLVSLARLDSADPPETLDLPEKPEKPAEMENAVTPVYPVSQATEEPQACLACLARKATVVSEVYLVLKARADHPVVVAPQEKWVPQEPLGLRVFVD